MNRRAFIAGLALAGAGARTGVARAAPEIVTDHPLQAAWTAWKAVYLRGDGRVVDDFQDGASHSEGQGYGMALATFFGDEPAFEAMRLWTMSTLAVRGDGLLSWKWRDGALLDRNNASDGDLLCAWALARAAGLFGRTELLDAARVLAEALVERCVVRHPDGSERLLLAPAVEGFIQDGAVIVNPSYLIPRAMRDLARLAQVPALARCAEDGLAMLDTLAAEMLAPDWIKITPEGFARPDALSAHSGYDAMRVGLYLAWSGLEAHPTVLRQRAAYRSAAEAEGGPITPTVFDPRSMAVIERSGHAGYAALRGLLLCLGDDAIGAAIPPFTTAQPYYPATLHLLVLVAQVERFPRCLPL